MSDTIAFIGGKDTVAGFRPLGVRTYAVSEPNEAVGAFHDCLRARVVILILTEPVAEMLEEQIRPLRFEPTPAILVVPSMTSRGGEGIRRLHTLVEKAVGADILSKEEEAEEEDPARAARA